MTWFFSDLWTFVVALLVVLFVSECLDWLAWLRSSRNVLDDYEVSYSYWCVACRCKCGGGICRHRSDIPAEAQPNVVCPNCEGYNICVMED